MASREHDEAESRLRTAGHRYSSNRRAIVDVLARASNPMTIPELVAESHRLPLSSAYRNLSVLEQAGVVHRIVTANEFARYELAEDLTAHHHHLICVSCGKVQDFQVSASFEESASDALARAASKAGFSLRSHKLDALGVCEECA